MTTIDAGVSIDALYVILRLVQIGVELLMLIALYHILIELVKARRIVRAETVAGATSEIEKLAAIKEAVEHVSAEQIASKHKD